MSKFLTQSFVLAATLVGVGCFPQTGTNTAATTGGNRFGYQGAVHSQGQPSGMIGQPTPAPDGQMAQAIRGTIPPAGTTGGVNQPIVADNLRPVAPPQGPNPIAPPPPPPPAPVNPTTPSTPPPASDLRGPNPTQPPSQPPPASQPTPQTQPSTYPVGIPVPGREGLVLSPYDKDAGHVDVRGLKPGSMVECPYTLKYFLVP